MCGIFTILEIKGEVDSLRKTALEQVKLIRHRGPDWSGIYSDANAILAHERLSIVDVATGAQPLMSNKTGCVLAVNGEIYNHKELRKTLKDNHDFKTNSDCEVILYLYEERGVDFLKDLNGIFAFVLYDPQKKTYLIARDHIGIIPLYTGRDKNGNLFVASEMKALHDICVLLNDFPPGHFCFGNDQKKIRYFTPAWREEQTLPTHLFNVEEFKTKFEHLSLEEKTELSQFR